MTSRRQFLHTLALAAPGVAAGCASFGAGGPSWPEPRQGRPQGLQTVREPTVAGQFYPADPAKLRAAIDGYLRDAVVAGPVEGPAIIVVPHAGYSFSGQIAADAYRQVSDVQVEAVVILGTNHTTAGFDKVSVFDGTGYRTPLGVAAVDRELAAALVIENGGAVFDSRLHATEHSVEVHVPFVQRVFPAAKVVPVVIGTPNPDVCAQFGRVLANLVKDRRVLVVASSDLSHYPKQRDAGTIDAATLRAIASLKPESLTSAIADAFTRGVDNLATCACGEGPIRVAMEAARHLGATGGTVVSYANSADTVPGDPARVVGYGAIVLDRRARAGVVSETLWPAPDPHGSLEPPDKRVLLRLARETVARQLTTDTLPLPRGGSPKLRREAGAFVTLTKYGEERGCVGQVQGAGPLIRLVSAMAVEAALRDPRFSPVRASELKDVSFELSVLTPMIPVSAPSDIVVGRDGVVLRVGARSAVFLPQVAAQQRWTRDQMLDNLAMKAGLPAQAWRGRDARFLTFRADVFKESDLG